MPDRIREAIFDILASRWSMPGTVPNTVAADLFAGSGSMGLEAMSRGATGCDFIERGRLALSAIGENLRRLDAGPAGRIIRGNAWTMPLDTPRPSNAYGLIFVDPPYADSSKQSRVVNLLSDLYRAGWADERSVIVLHHRDDTRFTARDVDTWRAFDRRTYGSAAVTFIDAPVALPDEQEVATQAPKNDEVHGTDELET